VSRPIEKFNKETVKRSKIYFLTGEITAGKASFFKGSKNLYACPLSRLASALDQY
jgi:tRNA A37 threonylcarbamoyladenosine biosynthesis protein TsaE